jgi:hypothetical protein
LFLQAAGSDYSTAHDLVSAVADTIRAAHFDQPATEIGDGLAPDRPSAYAEQIASSLQRAGYQGADNLLVTLAVLTTTASSARDVDVDWIAAAAGRVGDTDILLDAAGVIFAFNTINRIADARRVQLEYQFLRGLKPIRGWIERRLASLAGLAYDLSFKHQPRYSPSKLLYRLGILFERLGSPAMPDLFNWLSRSPVVLEGVFEMVESNANGARVRFDLLKEAMAIGAASRAMPNSGLMTAVEQWLPAGVQGDAKKLRAWAAPPGGSGDPTVVSACRRYAWQVANAAYTITDEQILKLYALGLSDAELLDLTLATAVFSALAIIEPIGAAVEAASIAAGKAPTVAAMPQVQLA